MHTFPRTCSVLINLQCSWNFSSLKFCPSSLKRFISFIILSRFDVRAPFLGPNWDPSEKVILVHIDTCVWWEGPSSFNNLPSSRIEMPNVHLASLVHRRIIFQLQPCVAFQIYVNDVEDSDHHQVQTALESLESWKRSMTWKRSSVTWTSAWTNLREREPYSSWGTKSVSLRWSLYQSFYEKWPTFKTTTKDWEEKKKRRWAWRLARMLRFWQFD